MQTRQDPRHLAQVLGNLVDVVFATDATLAPTFVSPSVERTLGVAREEACAGGLMAALHPDDSARLHELLASLSRGAPSAILELRFRNASAGEYLWFEALGSGFADQGGQFAGTVVALRQIDARKQAERVRSDIQAGRDALNEVARAIDRQILDGAQRGPLLRLVCEDIAATMNYALVWVALKSSDGSAPILASGGRAAAALEGCSVRWDDSPAGAGPTGTAMRTGKTQSFALTGLAGTDSIDRSLAAGIVHATAIPLMTPDAIMGVLCVSSGEAGPPDSQLLAALESFAGRLSLALQIAEHQALLALQGAAMASSANGLFITDAAGRIEWVNAAFERMSGYSRAEAIGNTPGLLRSELQSREVFANMWSSVRAGGTWRGEIVNRRKSGESYVVAQTVTPLLDGSGAVTHLVAAHEDVTAQRQAETLLEHLTHHDPLTDLPTRLLFAERVQIAISRADPEQEKVAVLFLDLDNFKLINDTLGHRVGDGLLREVATRLTSCVRDEDLVARLGGDEFAIVLPDCDAATAIQVAERILDKILQPVRVAAHDISITASIGIALSAPDAGQADALLKQADAAMYRAKAVGRNGYVLFTPGVDQLPGSSLTIQAGLRRALARHELTLHYQPQMDAAGGALMGVEALLRWTSPDLGVVSPASFIPMAEQTGIIAEIDRWVLRAACAQAKAWQVSGVKIPRVAVNVSGVSFRRGQLLTWIEEALSDAQLAPACLEIELTEGVVMHDATSVSDTLAELRRLGVRIALDDFGTGYSSLSYLKRFRLDALKIDRSFVSGLPHDQDGVAIARLIVAMAQALRLETIAEGVETADQARFLQSLGCTTLQGFLFSRALPADDLVRFMQGAHASGPPIFPAALGHDRVALRD
ncbi:MAG TPA: EAL domain-containing protein [Polyangia bacterium]|nr:EAL domain-containing protein [Polyangia bacterium]